MDTKRIESFKQFSKYLEYPMVVFEADSGKVLDINYEAEVLLGNQIETIKIEPGRAMTKFNFWDMLHGKKSLMWHRIRLFANDKEHLVSGLVNEATVGDKLIYTLLFEMRADLNIGSLTLERIVNHARIVALHLSKVDEEYKVEYVSKNINQYGYTSAQLYEGLVTLSDIVCAEDWERVHETSESAVFHHQAELVLECRLFTESRELIPVRMHMHYVYNDFSEFTDLEILVMDIREELQKSSENTYLSNAISRMKSVVVVKSFHAGKRTLKYISDNAGILGMNVAALKEGNKLTEDYIHPADRDMVIDTIYQAVANGVTDYVHTYRRVRDDGKQIWVQSEVSINRISDGEAEVSFLFTDVTEQKNIEMELSVAQEEVDMNPLATNQEGMALITIDQNDKEMLAQFQLMAETLSQNADYYSVVLDAEGKRLTRPVGPVNELGQFFDLCERPQYKEQFAKLSERAREELIPQSVSFTIDKMQVHMVFAPLMVVKAVTAYWVLTSFEKNGLEKLSAVIEQQWQLANAIAKCFYSEEIAHKEEKIRKLTEMQLYKEQHGRQVIQELLNAMTFEGEAGLGEMCQKAGRYLSVADIGIYIENKEKDKITKYYVWDYLGEEPNFFDTMELSATEYQVLKTHIADNQMLNVDRKTDEPFFKEMLRQTAMDSIMIFHIKPTTGICGYVIYADKGKQRVFDEKDISFASCVTKMFESMLVANHKGVKAEVAKEGFLEAYDHIRDAVFVKDNQTGEIIFTNKSMDKLFGYSLVGMAAKDVVNDQLEQYRNMSGMRKRFIANKKVSKWQSYMKELDQIMNIVEIHMETISNADCSLFILKKSKNKRAEADI